MSLLLYIYLFIYFISLILFIALLREMGLLNPFVENKENRAKNSSLTAPVFFSLLSGTVFKDREGNCAQLAQIMSDN